MKNNEFSINIKTTNGKCPSGEKVGKENQINNKIPVFSCEGACIRGEIARQAANILSKLEPYRRGCHGELITVPDSAIADWIKNAEKVILIDGCFLRCHGRIVENIIDEDKLLQFDALSYYKKYTDIFDIDDVPVEERINTSQSVVDGILQDLQNTEEKNEKSICNENQPGSCCV